MQHSLVAIAAVCALALAVAVQAQVPVTLDASKSVHPVSPLLWGIFYEEINHAGVGGFYSQLIQNPLFQSNTVSPWTATGCASAALDSTQPLNSVNAAAYLVSVSSSAACTVANGGYYGIAAKPGAAYSLSFYLFSSTALTATAGLRSSNGATVYAQTSVAVKANSTWTKYSASLTVPTSVTLDPNAAFFLSFPASSTAIKIWIQCVLLFPAESWHGLPYIRKDLGDMMEAMAPTFMRFPGGNYVEGNNIQQIMRWKNTVGPVEQRPGHQGTWGYWSPDHFGLFEELTFIETLGAEPIWVVNCGMTFGGMVPLDQLQPYIQDALDGIEFANGAPDSKWGSLRASLGHEKPFNLKYIALGNEEDLNGYLNDYKLRYPLFFNNISAVYPDMHIIANTLQVQTSAAPVKIQEIHQYNPPEQFYGEAHQYDNTDRSVPIFLSEYAVAGTWSVSNNTQNYYTLRAALGEAVFMSMLERNSDVVIMACYAPLFVADKNHGWDPDAITFDSYRAYGSPSYWNQVMWASEPGTDVLAITYDDKKNQIAISATSRPTESANTFEIVLKCVNYGATDIATTVTVTLPATAITKSRAVPRGSHHHKAAAAEQPAYLTGAAAGTWTLAAEAALTQMTAADQFAKNSFTDPEAVAPVDSTITLAPKVVDPTHTQFAYTFPKYAIQIIVLTVNLK